MPSDDPLLPQPDEPLPAVDPSFRVDADPVPAPLEPALHPLDGPLALPRLPLPPGPPHPGFWWSVLWSVVFLVVTQIIPAIVALVAVIAIFFISAPDLQTALDRLTQPEGKKEIESSYLPSAIALAELMVIFTPWLVIRLIAGKDWTRRIALRRPGALHVCLVVIGLPAMIVLANALYDWARAHLWGFKDIGFPDIEEQMKQFSEWPVWFAVLVIGVGPGIGEELWCRGFYGRGLVGRYGVVLGVVLTSFFFGMLHLDPPHVLATFAMGIVLHLSYLATRSLWVPILLHFLNNSLGVILTSKQVQPLPVLAAMEKASNDNPWPMLLAAAFLLLAVGWALYRGRARVVSPPGVEPWPPPYPGVEYPPPESGSVVVHPWPGSLPSLLVGIAVAVFVATVWALVPKG